ncbi:phenylacetyl-CoA ligase [Amylocystis lapponica]|nr:phenylacetyl-CoA ligase [Amylocystis lapponica]
MTLFYSRVPWIAPPTNLTLPQFLLDELHAHPTRPDRPLDVPCVIDEESGKKLYFQDLRSRTDALARSLSARFNIQNGDVVAVYAFNHPDFVICLWALQRLGAAAALINPALTEDELVYQLQIAEPTLLIAHLENLPVAVAGAQAIKLPKWRIVALDAEKAPKQTGFPSIETLINEGSSLCPFVEVVLGPEEGKSKLALLAFSSGTTGRPKAVAISHYNAICDVVQFSMSGGVNPEAVAQGKSMFLPGDVGTAVLPLYHVYGLLTDYHGLLYCGMTAVLFRKFNYERFLQSIQRYRITHMLLVPPHIVLFCKHPATKRYDLSSVRVCLAGAAPISASLTEQFLEVFPNIVFGQGFGMTETASMVAQCPTDQKIGTPGSVGQLVAGTVAKVVKQDGSLAGFGEVGELWVKGGQVTMGYYRNEQATKETFIDGWVRSGDEVFIRENGDMFITDRIKEFIKVKAFQVAPSELEGHLLTHPDVADAGVIAFPDEYSGEVPLAFIVLSEEKAASVRKDSAVAAELRTSICKHVADAKTKMKWLTGGVVFVDAIPKNPSGKILRRILREQAKNLPVRARL